MNRRDRRKNKAKGVEDLDFLNTLQKIINIHQSKNFAEAEKGYKKLLKNYPESYDLNRHLGILYQDTGRVPDSFDYFVKCIKKRPNGFEAYNSMGNSYILVKEYNLAITCFNKSLSLSENYIPAIINLASLYNKIGDAENSLKFASTLKNLQPENPQSINAYAKALILNHKLDDGIKFLEDLTKKYPSDEDFLFNLATAYRENGEFEKSKKIIDTRFKHLFQKLKEGAVVKNLNQYFAQYAGDKNNNLKTEEINFFQKKLKSNQLHVDQQIILNKAFFEYYRNSNNYQKSYEYLSRMNELCFNSEKYDINKDIYFFRELQQKKTYPPINNNKGSVTPIFICGMPRSGTTLCEQILSSHSKVVGAGELKYLMDLVGLQDIVQPNKEMADKYFSNIMDKDFLNNIREGYLNKISQLGNSSIKFICDKMPHNFVLIDLIRHILPESKIIYCKRDPIDNCFSLLTQRFVENRHNYCYDQKSLARYYLMHEELINFLIECHKKNIFILDNEELVNDQKNKILKLLEFCGLDWEDNVTEFYKSKRQVRTASLEQVRQPINKKSIGAWKNYEPFLKELVTGLKQNV